MVHVYTGKGKGKTTAALGLALRAAGHNSHVEIIQFMKKPRSSGEKNLIERMISKGIKNINLTRFGTKKPVMKKDRLAIHREQALKGLACVKRVLKNGKCDLLVLDEVNVAASYGLIRTGELTGILKKYGKKTEIILTGINCPEEIIKHADYVTQMKEVKHPFRNGVPARKAIEY